MSQNDILSVADKLSSTIALVVEEYDKARGHIRSALKKLVYELEKDTTYGTYSFRAPKDKPNPEKETFVLDNGSFYTVLTIEVMRPNRSAKFEIELTLTHNNCDNQGRPNVFDIESTHYSQVQCVYAPPDRNPTGYRIEGFDTFRYELVDLADKLIRSRPELIGSEKEKPVTVPLDPPPEDEEK